MNATACTPGVSGILARRLVQAGDLRDDGNGESDRPGKPYPKGVIYNWDSHAVNGHIFDDAESAASQFTIKLSLRW